MELSKSMKTMIEKMEAKGLSSNTIRYYLDRAYRLNNKQKFTSIKFLRDTDRIIPLLQKNLSTSTQKSYSGSIISILELYPNNLNRKSIEIYKKFISEEDIQQMNDDRDKKTEKQKDNWITLDEMKEIKKSLMEKINKIYFESLTATDYSNILKNFVLSLYLNLAPRRSKDFTLMKIASDEVQLENKNFNYLFDNKLIFNQYKTNKTYGQQVLDIAGNEQLLSDLNLYLKYRKTNDENFLLVKWNSSRFNESNDMTKILNSIFNKRISTQMLRNIYLSDKYSDVKSGMKQDSKEMATSLKMLVNNYTKDSNSK